MDTEPGHHFVKDQQCAFSLSDYTQAFKEARLRRNDTHIPCDRLDDNGRDLFRVFLEQGFYRRNAVKIRDQRIFDCIRWHTW